MQVAKSLSRIKVIYVPLHFVYKLWLDVFLFFKYKQSIMRPRRKEKRIYYLGIPAHANLGDLAQGVCIRNWLAKHYGECEIIEVETNAIVNNRFSVLPSLIKNFKEYDFIIFQSGYTTTDLGGFADVMHQTVMKALPEARILMMPQTIFFSSEARRKLCASIYNAHKRMLFLARDYVSYEMAKEMFPDIQLDCFPDIVTTLIGEKHIHKYNRDGIIFCLRNDGEKYYSDRDIEELVEKCRKIAPVQKTDTTKKKNVIRHAEKYIEEEIKEYSKYKVLVTDRFHGTILSLVAETPVVIIRTNDHKVTTGAEWFRHIYDDYVYLAQDLKEAFEIVSELYTKEISSQIQPYFDKKYYDLLPALFDSKVK